MSFCISSLNQRNCESSKEIFFIKRPIMYWKQKSVSFFMGSFYAPIDYSICFMRLFVAIFCITLITRWHIRIGKKKKPLRRPPSDCCLTVIGGILSDRGTCYGLLLIIIINYYSYNVTKVEQTDLTLHTKRLCLSSTMEHTVCHCIGVLYKVFHGSTLRSRLEGSLSGGAS